MHRADSFPLRSGHGDVRRSAGCRAGTRIHDPRGGAVQSGKAGCTRTPSFLSSFDAHRKSLDDGQRNNTLSAPTTQFGGGGLNTQPHNP